VWQVTVITKACSFLQLNTLNSLHCAGGKCHQAGYMISILDTQLPVTKYWCIAPPLPFFPPLVSIYRNPHFCLLFLYQSCFTYHWMKRLTWVTSDLSLLGVHLHVIEWTKKLHRFPLPSSCTAASQKVSLFKWKQLEKMLGTIHQ
jgi:hypothetical protein